MDNNNSVEVNKRDGWFRVHISGNYMEASLELEPPLGEGKWPTKADAVAALRSEGIMYGVMEEVIDRIIEGNLTEPVIVAKGKPAEPGVDAQINILFETGAVWKFSEDEDSAKVDYRNIQTIQSVQIGEVLAEKIPATKGEPGFDIYGRTVSPQAGKDKFIKLGKNVAWTEDNLKIFSKINGEPNYVMNQINVFPVHEVNGDVNFKSGNIIFPGSLVIRGNVDSGFRVEADGDITINGSVEAADIKAGGNITVRGGITGRDKCNVSCDGDFAAKYVEYAKIDCDGSVTVKEAIMHCEVNANSRVLVEMGKGLIVGGVVRSGEDISVKTVGSKFGTATELEAGVKPKLKIEYQQLETLLATNKENLDKAEKAIAILEKMPQLPPERYEMYQNLRK
ncbi:MAG TPA: FapA family protein, partial [Bacillota bacterium]|nr:FapA family protein [Bacillota bacterium]